MCYLRKDVWTLDIEYRDFDVPAMVDVNGTVYHLRMDIWILGTG